MQRFNNGIIIFQSLLFKKKKKPQQNPHKTKTPSIPPSPKPQTKPRTARTHSKSCFAMICAYVRMKAELGMMGWLL